jgi:hypothetical protein
MELWHAWTGLLQQILQMLATDCGLGAGLAIVILTLAMRTVLLPITWAVLDYDEHVRRCTDNRIAPSRQKVRLMSRVRD